MYLDISGVELNVGMHGSRIVWLVMLELAVILYGSFQAILTTNLSIVKVTYPFTGLHDLYHDTQYRIGGLAESSNEGVFEVPTKTSIHMAFLKQYLLDSWTL